MLINRDFTGEHFEGGEQDFQQLETFLRDYLSGNILRWWLDRKGRKLDETVALPVKDPFHLPRGLIHSIESLGRLQRRPRVAEDKTS